MPKILLLNDTAFIRNWGSQATGFALRSILEDSIPGLELMNWSQEKLARTFHRLKLPLIPAFYKLVGGSIGKKSNSPLSPLRARSEASPDPIFPANANSYEITQRRWNAESNHPLIRDALDDIQSADMVLHNAELLNHSYNIISQRGAFLLWLAKIQFGKPAGMINQTTPGIDGDPVMSGVLRRVCPELDLVTVREKRSLATMTTWGIESELVPDPTFWITEAEFDDASFADWRTEHGLDGQPYFCVSTSSGLPVAGGASGFARMIQSLQRLVPNTVLLLTGGGGWLLKSAAKDLPNCHVFDGAFGALGPLFRESRFLVSGHYHNIIFAAIAGCPFVPLASVSHKVQGLLELIEWPYPECFNPTAIDLELDSIFASAEIILAEKSSLKHHLVLRTGELRTEAARTGTMVREVLSGRQMA